MGEGDGGTQEDGMHGDARGRGEDDGQAVPTSLLQVPGAGCAYRRDRL